MAKTLSFLKDSEPLHTQPENTLVAASPFHEVEEESQAPAPSTNYYAREHQGVKLDVYRILRLYNVTDPAIAHAVKKLLRFGSGGHKDAAKDVAEALESLERWQEMQEEDAE